MECSYVFLVSAGCGRRSLVTAPALNEGVIFFLIFLFFSSLICDLSEIIKCWDCFGLPSMGIYPTRKHQSSSPELCFHSGHLTGLRWGR